MNKVKMIRLLLGKLDLTSDDSGMLLTIAGRCGRDRTYL